MRATVLAASAMALLAPGVASAFPIAVGAAGVGLLGVMALPLLLIAAGAFWVVRNKGRGLIPLLALAAASAVFMFLVRDFGQEQAVKVALFTKADTAYLSPPIPFPFIDLDEQAKSKQAVTPAEFVDGLSQGHFKALKISTYPSLFTATGQVAVDDFWRDKQVLIDAVNGLGGRVVLVDEYGGIAASIAGAALAKFGLNVGFLQGGTVALSQYGWSVADQGGIDTAGAVSAEDYKSWIAAHPKAYVLGLTTDREFVEDGWLFGDRTLSLADVVANYQALVMEILGREVFIVGFETNDTGATHIAAQLLRDAGVKVHFVMPSQDEILIKPAYYNAYQNDTRTVSVEDAERYILHRPDVEFLDFSENPWPIGVDFLKDRYHHLPMPEVAKGNLAAFVGQLDPGKVYVGLSFDRRTAYHSLLAGELLSQRGASWLGRFTLASSLTEPFLTVEDLNTDEEQVAYALRQAGAHTGLYIIGHGLLGAAIAGLALSVALLVMSRRRPIKSAVVAIVAGAGYACVMQANADYPFVATAYDVFMYASSVGAGFAILVAYGRRVPRIVAFSNYTTTLPAKAALLNVAAARGHHVLKGVVASPTDLPELAAVRFKRARYIVRSAAYCEAANHGETAGVFESIVCESSGEIQEAATRVFGSFTAARVDGAVLVQPYVKAKWYGVIQLQRNELSPLIICEVGQAEAVTSGQAPAHSFQFPAWDLKAAPKLIRKAAAALLDLLEVGAYSLEFAITSSGRLIILQVNQADFRACAEIRLIRAASKQVIEVDSAHADPLSAGLVAALSAGHIFSYGSRRYCEVASPWKTKGTLRDDLEALGLNAGSLKAEHLVAWVDRYARSPEWTAACEVNVASVVAAINSAANSLGRINRVASTLLVIGKSEGWSHDARQTASSIVGEQVHQGVTPVWGGAEVGPMIGFSVQGADDNFDPDCLPPEPQYAPSPLYWVKDASSVMLAARLAAIKPAVVALIESGHADQLLSLLESNVGDWDALQPCAVREVIGAAKQPFKEILLGDQRKLNSWRVPASGIDGVIQTPFAAVGCGVLLIDQCRMDYLPLLSSATAVVAMSGSITSHLMQHAEAMRLPVIIGGDIASGLIPGERVRVNADGSVVRA